MRLAYALLLLTSVAAAEPPKLPAHYAKMFVKGHAITYDVTGTFWDSAKMAAREAKGVDYSKIPSSRWPRTTDRSVITCKVARVETFSSSIVSEITCDAELSPRLPIAGVFLANAQGLFELGELPSKEAELPAASELDAPLIPAAPKAWRKETRLSAQEQGGRAYQGVKYEGGAWCRFEGLAGNGAGHNGDSQRCFGRGVIASGLHDYGPELRLWRFRAR